MSELTHPQGDSFNPKTALAINRKELKVRTAAERSRMADRQNHKEKILMACRLRRASPDSVWVSHDSVGLPFGCGLAAL